MSLFTEPLGAILFLCMVILDDVFPPQNGIYPYPLIHVQKKIYYACHLVWVHTPPQAGDEPGWYQSSGWHRHVWTGGRDADGVSALCTRKLF